MKAITLWQPWAAWVARGTKTIETRTHCRFRGLVGSRIAIHAGLKWDASAFSSWILPNGEPFYFPPGPCRPTCRHGEIVCTVDVVCADWLDASHSHSAMIDCGGDIRRFGLFLEGVEWLPRGYRVSGRRGIWDWDESCPGLLPSQ